MPTIDATVGGADANSYATVGEFFAYSDGRLGIDWASLTGPDVDRALIQATIELDGLDYIGDIATDTQALKWPRIENDLYTNTDREFPFDDDEIPQRLKYAEIEWALAILEEDQSGVSASSASSPVSSLKIGSTVQVEYDTSSGATVTATADPQAVPIRAARMLRGLRLHPVLA